MHGMLRLIPASADADTHLSCEGGCASLANEVRLRSPSTGTSSSALMLTSDFSRLQPLLLLPMLVPLPLFLLRRR